MLKIYSFLLFLFLWVNVVFAQESEKRNCGTVEYMHELELQHSDVKWKRALIEEQTNHYLAHSHEYKKNRTIITIPVVVHVVYNLQSGNISEAQIQSQIDVLNKDFRKVNTDFGNTPGIFQPLAADCEIQFVLAKRDPNGDSTNGITRTYTAVSTFNGNNNVKNSATGGKDPWPSDQYLNIWVCKLSNGLLGFGQFPGGPASTDGVVIANKAFGTMGTALAPFNKGRTTTHEVGHWLNLFHIWGDDGGGCFGSDMVDDTPNQGAENYGCPSFPKISCNNTPHGDMFMNFMDYTDDACMTMFTLGQKNRMEALFIPGGARYSLLSSMGAQYPTPPVVCVAPTGTQSLNITQTSAQLIWDIVPNANSYTVQYKVSDSLVWQNANAVQNVLVLNNLLPNTIYEWRVKTMCNNGESNYSINSTFTTLQQIVINNCSNSYEPNNTYATAYSLTMNDTVIYSMISNASDNDYYKFQIDKFKPNFKVTLSELPADYDLYLYSPSGSLITLSQGGGLKNEVVKFNPGIVTVDLNYIVRVKSYNGAFADNLCYKLTIESAASAFREEEENTIITVSEDIKIYPIPASDFLNLEYKRDNSSTLYCNIYSAFGQKVMTKELNGKKGINKDNINISSLPNGVYFIEMVDNNKVETLRINVTR